MTISDYIWSLVGFLLTIMVLSYLVGDNFFFRLAVHLFIGLTAGYVAVLLVRQILLPQLVIPLVNGSSPQRFWLVLPLALVLLLLVGQIPKFSAAAIIPLAYLAGLAAAIVIGGAVFGTLLPQSRSILDAFDPGRWYALPEQTWLRILDAVVMLFGTVGVLSYFHFGRKIKRESQNDAGKRPLILEGLGKVGQVFIGVTLGAVFAGIFSTALIALIDRLVFIGEMLTRIFGGL
jgi:CBS domain containing-hemolysin-like protein